MNRYYLWLMATALLLLVTAQPTSAAPAATITVTANSADVLDANGGDCSTMTAAHLPGANNETSLREAICVANNTAGADIIDVPAGAYTLAIAGQNEDGNATGDLDITDDLTISGAGAATTIIQAGTDATNGIDRVFHIFQPGSYVSLALNDLTIRNGRAPDNTPGGGIHGSSHILILTDSIVSNNAAGNGSSGGNGGGIYLEEDGDLTMSNSQVLDNVAGDGATSRGGSGGGIYLSKATATISGGSVINGNRTGDGGPNSYGGSGGGIYSSSRPLSVTDSFVRDNSTGSGGPGGYGGNGAGIYASNNTLTIDRNEISGNAASASGGGLYVEMYAFYPAVTLSDNVVSNNSAGIDGSGGGIHVSAGTGGPGGSLTLLDHQITGNTAVRNGGGIYVSSQLDTVTFTRLTVTGNSSAVGGGAAIIQAHLVSVTDSQFVDNNAFGTNCPQCQVPPDTYNKGGGLWVQGDSGDATDLVDVTGSTFTGNHAGEWGGGIATEDTMVSIELTSVSNNNSRRDGGGMAIIWSEDVKILDSTIDGNTASSGGGIYVADSNFGDPVTITGSTISNNTSDGLASETRVGGSDPDYLGSGGGVFIETGQMDVTNSTISGNNTASNGGGIFMDFPDGNISYTTMANNSAGNQGGGIYAISPSVTLQTTIVADNTAPTAGPDCYDQGGLSNPFSGGSYNLISSLSPASGFGSCANAFNDPTDIVDQDPQLGPLQDNGGPTLTHALAPSSPAMSQVPQSSNGCGTDVVDDQRALSRPGAYMPADRCEVGAWEAQAEDILYDFADAPDTGSGTGQDNYETLATSGGPSHLIVAGLHLGSVAPDGDDGSLQNGGATADDDDNVDDEEGVSALPTITDRSQSVALTVDYTNASGSPATLACWIDFNRDGLFASSERAAATVTSDGGNNPRSETLTFSGFGTPVLGDSYIRCRIATVAGEVADAVGPANSGEVEDVQVAISAAPKDYGDAPDSPYATTASNGGPSHVIVAGLHLGSVAPDADDGTLQNAAALADDDNNTDDEDGISTLPTITDKSQSVALTVDYTNASGSPAILACWIDFNRDGLFASSERAAATVSSDGNNPRSETLTFSGFGTPVLGDSYIRCRIASAAGEVANPTGPANSGEVEDVQVTIIAAPKDWGDAPDSPYATTASNGGPSHVIVAGLHLGSVAPDADDGTLQNAAALADDDNNTDDEDGLSTLPTITDKSQSVALTVDYTNASGSPAILACWIDFNRDGVFASSERAAATVSSEGGNNPRSETLTFSGFGTPVLGDSYIRCRIATVAGEVADAVGPANSGEVEDVQVTISAAPMDFGDAPDSPYATKASNGGPSHVIVAGLHLGSVAPDADNGSLENSKADDDDKTGSDDEDGIKPVNMPTITTDTSGLVLKVDATNNTNADATLACWIDFSRNGSFGETGEGVSASVSVPAGSGTQEYALTFGGFAAPVEGDSIIRCRIAHQANEVASPVGGPAASGEVEDTLVKITKALGVELNSFAAERDGDVVNFRWETGTETGNAGFNLFVETGDGLALINQELIPSSVIDSAAPTAYSHSAAVAGERFYIDLVGVEGGSERYGPYTLSQSGGLPDGVEMTPAVWLPIVVR